MVTSFLISLSQDVFNSWVAIYDLKKWANPGLFFCFIFVFSTCYNLNWKKHRWCAWDLNPGRQDGRREWIHWATAAPHLSITCRGCFKHLVWQFILAHIPYYLVDLNSHLTLFVAPLSHVVKRQFIVIFVKLHKD